MLFYTKSWYYKLKDYFISTGRKNMKRLFLAGVLAFVLCNGVYARTTESVPADMGYDPYSGFITADMIMENGVISNMAAYSTQFFHDFGLVPVVYCSSAGSRFGTYYIFYVNPYHDCLIVGKTGFASHGHVFETQLKPFALTGESKYAINFDKYRELYTKIIRVAKKEFYKYKNVEK